MIQDKRAEWFDETLQKAGPASVDCGSETCWHGLMRSSGSTKLLNGYFKSIKVQTQHPDTLVWEMCRRIPIPKLNREWVWRGTILPKGIGVIGEQGRVDAFGDRGKRHWLAIRRFAGSIMVLRTPSLHVFPWIREFTHRT